MSLLPQQYIPPSPPTPQVKPPAGAICLNVDGAQYVVPSPTKLWSHAQVNEPDVLLQLACFAHGDAVAAHSLISEQVLPSPSNPALHAQEYPSGVSVHVALVSHAARPVAHSSIFPSCASGIPN